MREEPIAGAARRLARAQIEQESMQRTDDRVAADETVCERSAAMGAFGARRKDLAGPAAEHGDVEAANVKDARLAEGDAIESDRARGVRLLRSSDPLRLDVPHAGAELQRMHGHRALLPRVDERVHGRLHRRVEIGADALGVVDQQALQVGDADTLDEVVRSSRDSARARGSTA